MTQRYTGIDVTVWECFRAASNRYGRLLAANILSGLGITAGLIFCLAPGFYLMLAWIVTYPVLMFEDAGAFDSIERSWVLMRGHKLKALVTMALVVIVTGPPYALSTFWLQHTVSAVVDGAAAAIDFVLTSVFTSVIYFSARCATEPLTMDALSLTISERGDGAPSLQ